MASASLQTTGAKFTSSVTRDLLELKAKAYAAPLAALPQQCRMKAKVTDTVELSRDSNDRLQQMQAQMQAQRTQLDSITDRQYC